MNIDEIISRLKEPHREDYLDYLRALNPTLIHFFNFFTDNATESQQWFQELSENFFLKIKGRSSTPKKCKTLILSGAVNLINRKKQTQIFRRCNELIYEKIPLQPLPKKIFSIDYIPNIEDLERFRKQELSTPMCLILDLAFQENLEIQEIAKILKLSENVLEPFLFTVIHQLIGETSIETTDEEDELELFTKLLHSQANTQSKSEFSQRFNYLKNFLSLDIRSRSEQQTLIDLGNRHFPINEIEPKSNQTNPNVSTPSLIDQIKKRNRDMKLEEVAKQFSKEESSLATEIDLYSAPPSTNTAIFAYAKYAVGILAIFTGMVFYQTIFDKRKIPQVESIDHLKSTSITDFQNQLNRPLGTLSTPENEISVSKMQWITQKNNPATLTLHPNVDIQISENTKLQIRSREELFLKFGSIKVKTQNSNISIYTNHGHVHVGINGDSYSSAHVAKPNSNYSIAANLNGKLTVEDAVNEQLIKLNIGKQIIFGNGSNSKLSSYNSAYFSPRLGSSQFNRQQSNNMSQQIFSNTLSNAELEDILLSVEKVIKKPSVQQKDFSQKL